MTRARSARPSRWPCGRTSAASWPRPCRSTAFSRIPRASKSPDERMYRRYKDKLGPAIGVTLHMGNWELAIWPFTLAGNNPAAVYRTVKNPYVDRVHQRTSAGISTPARLGRGRTAGGRADDGAADHGLRAPGWSAGHWCATCTTAPGCPCPSSVEPARSVIIPAMIARRVGARIWMARCLRVGTQSRFQHRAQGAEGAAHRQRGRRRELDHRGNAKAVRGLGPRGPEQWMWSNRRWG